MLYLCLNYHNMHVILLIVLDLGFNHGKALEDDQLYYRTSQSPELNPIKDVWNGLKSAMHMQSSLSLLDFNIFFI